LYEGTPDLTQSDDHRTSLPMTFSGNAFLSAAVLPAPQGLPGGINPVTWKGHFTATRRA